MSEYEIGKDVQRLQQRIEALEGSLAANASCEGCAERAAVPVVDVDVVTAESKSWRLPGHETGKCELRDPAHLTLLRDGRFRAIGVRECNTSGPKSCKTFEVKVAFFRQGSSGPIEVARQTVASGLLGPGAAEDFQADGSDQVLADLFNQITGASMWVFRCST